jgi:AraC family transcriptional regulator of adaptative response / DNA-3-methyladenine glycosylase II
VLGLSYRPPLDWEALLDFYRAHRIEGVESVSATAYERTFVLDGVAGLVQVTHAPDKPELRLRVIADDHRCLFPLVQIVRRMFDLDSDPVLVANAFTPCPVLSRMYKRRPGLRIARGWSAIEVAVCAILGQLVSTAHARRLFRALIQHYGEQGVHPLTGEACRHFPDAARLAHARLAELGITRAKREAIRAFAGQVVSGELSLSPAQDPAEFKARLRRIPGIGAWTAEYIALRALGDVDAFPAGDLILKRALALQPEINLEAVRPWRGYAAVHLWREYAAALSGKG